MKIAVVKYNAGNIGSVINALKRLGAEAEVTSDPETIRSSDRVIFPGVGEASSAMRSLRQSGLDKVLPHLDQPVLGICLGLHLLCEYSEENNTECLGVFTARVRKFTSESLKVPHIGWNTVGDLSGDIFQGLGDGSYLYFVHGFFVEIADDTIATCDYGETFSAALAKRNFRAVQFHPEKSGKVGERILKNFLSGGK